MPPSNPNRATLPEIAYNRGEGSGITRRSASEPVPALRLASVGATHVGKRRKKNEDRYAIDDAHHAYVVCDGMGGHAAGEIAAQIAADTIASFLSETSVDPEQTWPYPLDPARTWDENRLAHAFRCANETILGQAAANPRLRGMGTTAVALLASHDGVTLAHVGDSRAYLARNGQLTQLTADHTLYNELRRAHLSDPDLIAPTEAQRNVLVRALGTEPNLAVDLAQVEPRSGDLFVLCTDGLYGPVPDDVILSTVFSCRTLDLAARTLVDRANAAGGPDNVTVVLVRWP